MIAFKTLSSQHLILSDCCLKFFQVERLKVGDILKPTFGKCFFRQGYHINSQRADIINKSAFGEVITSRHLAAPFPKKQTFPFSSQEA